VYTAIALIAVIFGYKETNQHISRDRLKFSYIGTTYFELLKSRLFMGVTAATFLSYGGLFAWFVAGPVLLIHVIGISPMAFGLISFFGGGFAYALAGWLNGHYVKKFGMDAMLDFGWAVMVGSSILMFLGYYVLGITTIAIVIPAMFFYFGSTFIWPNAFAMSFTPFGKIAGYTGALYGFMTLGGAAAIGGLVSYLPDDTQLPLASVMLGCSAVSWFLFKMLVKN